MPAGLSSRLSDQRRTRYVSHNSRRQRHVLEQARSIEIDRVVYTSSIVTIGYSSDRNMILDETSSALIPASKYHIAKWHAERLALDFSTQTGLPVVVVNPSSIVGPLDFRLTPSNAPIQRCIDRGLPIFFRGGLTVAHAQDVARGHFLAMERGTPGQRYILGGDQITIQDYFKLISELCGRRAPILELPQWMLQALGYGFSLLQRINRSPVPFYAQPSEALLVQVRLVQQRKGTGRSGLLMASHPRGGSKLHRVGSRMRCNLTSLALGVELFHNCSGFCLQNINDFKTPSIRSKNVVDNHGV